MTTEQGTARAITLTGSDPLYPSNLLTYTVIANPGHGVLSGAAPNLTYTPAAGFAGVDSVRFKVNNGTLDSAPATISITVMARETTPVSTNDAYTTVQNRPLAVAASGVLANDGPQGTAHIAILVDGPAHGTLTFSEDGSFSYTPSPNYFGPDSFTYVAAAGAVRGNEAIVNLTVTRLPTRLFPDTGYFNRLRQRRARNPAAFDAGDPITGALLQLESTGIPTVPTKLVVSSKRLNTVASRKRFARNPAAFDKRDAILGALFRLELAGPGPAPTHLLPETRQYAGLRAAYYRDPAQFQGKRANLGAVIELEYIENGGRPVL